MKKFSLFILAGCFCALTCVGQVTLTTSPYTQDFNSISSGLPTGWTVRTGATGIALGTTSSFVTTNTAWNSTTGNFRNVASASGLTSTATTTDQGNSTNRALAVRQTGTLGDPGAAFVLQLANTTGFTNFQLSFRLQSLDGTTAGRTTTWRVDYGFGATPSSFTAATTNPATLTTVLAAGGASWGSTDVTVNFGTALDNNSGNVWIRITTLAASSGSGSRPTSAIDDFQLTFSNVDNTAPVFNSGYPKAVSLTTSGFDLVSNISESGKTYFVILPNNATAPASAEVKSGNDAVGNTLPAGFFGSFNNTSANTDFSTTINSLASGTDYDVYVVAEDGLSNVQASPNKLDVLTNTAGDITPPSYSSSYPTINTILPTGFTVRTSLDELGKTYFVVVPLGASAPSSAQVKNGQDGAGLTLASNQTGTIIVSSSGTEFTANVSGLSPTTSYDVYVVAEDNVPNIQASPVKITITTGAQFVEDFNVCDGTASFTQFSVSGGQSWGCTDFGRNSTKGIRMNGFSGTAQLNEDWLISPVVSLNANAALSFYSQFSFAGPSLQLKISTNYTGSGDPSVASWTDLNGNFPTVAVPSNSTSSSDWTFSNVDLSAYSGQNIFIAFVYTSTTGTNTAARWSLDDITFANGVARFIQTSPSALLFTAGNAVKSYTLKGNNVTGNINVNAPSNFEVSKDNNAFSNSISFTASEANAQTTIFVRFNLATPSTNTFTGVISHSSSGISTKEVLVTGTDKSLTFDVVTWNLEWFSITADQNGVGVGPGAGSGPRTPSQVALQRANVANVIKTIDADLYAFQEVGNESANFDGLVTDLGPGWAGIRSPTPAVPSSSYGTDGDKVQRLAIIYKTSVVNPVSTRALLSTVNTASLSGYPSTNDRFWASGRFPFLITANVTLGGITKQIDFVNIHARANGGSTAADQKNRYDMRRYDVEFLKDSLDARFAARNLIMLGDYNDDVKQTVVAAAGTTESSYKKYVDDNLNYQVLTLPLSQANAVTFVGSSLSMLDHVVLSNELSNDYLTSSTTVEDPRSYITNYVNSTSDHLPVSARFVITKSNQTIAFNSLPNKTFGDAPFAVSAAATSGLPVSFSSSDLTVASVSGNTITILKAGTVTITASQNGNANFNAAPNASQQLTINKADQSITFNTLASRTFGDAPFNLTATSTSLLPVSFESSDATIASINGSTVTILKAGTVTITASQAGDGNYNPAPNAIQQFVVNKANQQITFTAISDKQLGDAPFPLNANTNAGLPVTFTALTSDKVTIANNQATIVAGGRAIIVASQPGNANYNAATAVDQTFCIKPNKPTVNISLASGNATLTSSASGGYKWFLNGTLIPNANGQSYIATLAGTYKVQVNLDDCLSDFSNDVPVVITGDLSGGPTTAIQAYPNPTSNLLLISGLAKETNQCLVVDVLGRAVEMPLENVGERHQLNVEGLNEGMYVIRIKQNNSIEQLRLVKNN
ncbi:MAG: choice-of-anchor J domain-containing protein [Flammeovirgaceae bacterium]|jgi:hypothetical protein|nr:choice-of-anchor J domain-containing protein [Flammeovirgaceae bacterium]